MDQPAAHKIITLTTDFGSADGFPAAMKGVILGLNAQASIVDVSHDLPIHSVASASFVLGAVTPAFPVGAIHIAVVDPGVGAGRRSLVLCDPDGSLYVGPDNGVFSHVLSRAGPLAWSGGGRRFMAPAVGPLPPGFAAHAIENPVYMRPEVSHTFHGRDVFAPVAARLSLRVPVKDIGPAVSEIVCLNLPGPRLNGHRLTGHVQYVDRFGNLVTDIPAGAAAGFRSLTVLRTVIQALSASYEEAGSIGCVVGSHGFLEISAYRSSVATELGAGIGDEVIVDL